MVVVEDNREVNVNRYTHTRLMTDKPTKKKEYDGSTPITGRFSILHEAFVDNIIANIVQYKAYQLAGYKPKSVEVAKAAASRLLTKVNVRLRLAYLRAQLAKKQDITAEKVIKEMAKIGFSNIQDFIESGNEIRDLSELNPSIAAAVESIQSDIRHDSGKSEGYIEKVKIKLHSKLGALNSLAEILKLKDVAGKTDIKILHIAGLDPVGDGLCQP